MPADMNMANASDSESSYYDNSDASSLDSGCNVWTTNVSDEFEDQCWVGNKLQVQPAVLLPPEVRDAERLDG